MLARHDVRLQSLAQNRQLAFQRAPVGEFEQTQSFVIRDRQHCTERGLDSFGKHAGTRFRRGRRIAEDAGERFAKTAGRFETAAILRFIHATAFAHFAQRESHSPGAMIGLKRHSIMTLELPARRRGIDGERGQFLVGQPPARGAFDFRPQLLDQLRRTLARIHRPAAQAWPVAAMQCFTRRRKKIDVRPRRLFRRTGRPAENSGRAHTDEKNSFEARVAIHQCAIHRVGGREQFHCFHMRFDLHRVATAADAADVNESSFRPLQEPFNHSFGSLSVRHFGVNHIVMRIVGAKHPALSKLRRKLVRGRVAFTRFRVDENRSAFRVGPARCNGRERKQDHSAPRDVPSEDSAGKDILPEIRRDEDVVWRARLSLAAGCLCHIGLNRNNSKVRSFHGGSLSAVDQSRIDGIQAANSGDSLQVIGRLRTPQRGVPPSQSGGLETRPSLKITWLIHASIKIPFLPGNRDQSDSVGLNEISHQWLQGKIFSGESCGKMRGSFSWINGGERLGAFADDWNYTAPRRCVTTESLHLFDGHKRHVDRQDDKVRCLDRGQSFR